MSHEEEIARVVRDVRTGKAVPDQFIRPDGSNAGISQVVNDCCARDIPIVNASALIDSLFGNREGPARISVYDDFPCVTPPFPEAIYCYRNRYGNVVVVYTELLDLRKDDVDPSKIRWSSENIIDWNTVRWIALSFPYIGGLSDGRRLMATSGPHANFRYAISETGAAVDISISTFSKQPFLAPGRDLTETWSLIVAGLSNTWNFLNCTNVQATTPRRPRGLRRTLERMDVDLKDIVVRRPGMSRTDPSAWEPIAQPDGVGASPVVRGHFAHYGPEYNKGLLFGRLAGKFWIPAHARGQAELGVRNYTIK